MTQERYEQVARLLLPPPFFSLETNDPGSYATRRMMAVRSVHICMNALQTQGTQAGAHGVVGADDQSHIRLCKVRVDLLHLKDDIIGHPSFGQQHIELPGHAACHRVDPKPVDVCRNCK